MTIKEFIGKLKECPTDSEIVFSDKDTEYSLSDIVIYTEAGNVEILLEK